MKESLDENLIPDFLKNDEVPTPLKNAEARDRYLRARIAKKRGLNPGISWGELNFIAAETTRIKTTEKLGLSKEANWNDIIWEFKKKRSP
jgi:hypothetical protein